MRPYTANAFERVNQRTSYLGGVSRPVPGFQNSALLLLCLPAQRAHYFQIVHRKSYMGRLRLPPPPGVNTCPLERFFPGRDGGCPAWGQWKG